ncbi:MAG: methylated-DNA--[protein]-cysteine S-methyltransferase [Dehalococcoidia bacterium]|nr:methylated-DNA--[protein]-cysteine S-methyltransferase [Dehalococcoidia bacterium]
MSVRAGTEPLAVGVAETKLGFAGVALSPHGIRHATLFHRSREAAVRELLAFGASGEEDPRAEDACALLRAYAAGEGSLEEYPVDLPPASDLQRRTWLALRQIPRGETRSYGWLGRLVGAENARTVGAIVGANPVPLWLPCHRVVASDGRLQGFGGGLAMKQALLELEGALPRRLVG